MNRLRRWAAPTPALALLGVVVLVLAGLWTLAQANATGSLAGVGLLLLAAIRAGAAVQSQSAARRLGDSAIGRPWRFLATAWSLAALGTVLGWGRWALAGQPPPVPSVSDLLLLAAAACALWAVASYGAAPRERFGRLRNWLDVAIVFLSILGLVWMTLLQPVLQVGIASPVQAFWGLLWPALELVFLALLLRLLILADPGAERRSLGLLGVSGLLALAGDAVAASAAITGDAPPAFRVEVLSILAASLGLLAAWQASRLPIVAAATVPARPRRPPQAETLLPIAFTYLAVGYVAVDAWIQGNVNDFGLGVSIALTLLLFVRQGVVAGQSEMRQYAALVEGAADMAFICQADGRISFVNPAFAAALGRPADPGKDLHLKDILAPDQDAATPLESGADQGWSDEVVFLRSDGTRFPARLSLRPVVLERQRHPLLAGSAVDLTQMKEREALLRSALDDVAAARVELMALNRDLEVKVSERTLELQRTVEDLDRLNRELRALDQMKSEFVTLVSHELRAPLTNIRAGVELLLPEEAGLPPAARSSLQLIQQETARLGGFVEAILDLSALEAGRFPLRLAPLDFAAEARAALERFRSTAGYDRIAIELPSDLPPVEADERALASVLYHLVDNALKYAPDGEVRLEAEAEPERLVAAVSDHGPGIPDADRERVFDMFHRLDSSDAREVYGHGLGLHLVRRLLEAMHGGIRAEEASGGGARLIFWLPTAAALESPAGAGGASQGSGRAEAT